MEPQQVITNAGVLTRALTSSQVREIVSNFKTIIAEMVTITLIDDRTSGWPSQQDAIARVASIEGIQKAEEAVVDMLNQLVLPSNQSKVPDSDGV